jgi:hypothetical protein
MEPKWLEGQIPRERIHLHRVAARFDLGEKGLPASAQCQVLAISIKAGALAKPAHQSNNRAIAALATSATWIRKSSPMSAL